MGTPVQAVFSDARFVDVVQTLTGVDMDFSKSKDEVQSLTQQNGLLQGEIDANGGTITGLKDALKAAEDRLAAIASTVVFDDLELTPWLLAPGTSANSGQTGSTAVATQGLQGVTSAWFNLAPNGPYANGYWYRKLGADAKKSKYLYEIPFLFGSAADAAASNCIELDIQQVIAGRVFNTGLQFDFTENALRVWDRSSATPADTGKGDWVTTGFPCPRWTPGQWVKVALATHRDDTHVYYDSIDVNGLHVQPTMVFAAPLLGLSDMLNCAVQLDGNKTGTPYRVYRGRTRFTAS